MGRKSHKQDCINCGEEFKCKPSSKRKFCCRECCTAHRKKNHVSTKVECLCEYCGSTYFTFKAQIRKGSRFCSQECKQRSERNREIRECKVCNSVFEVWPSSKALYCSHKCRGEDSRGAHYRYNKSTSRTYKSIQWAIKVKERDNYTCQRCGDTDRDMHSHHILGYMDNINRRYDLDNGICLCAECHYEYHRIYGKVGSTISDLIEFCEVNTDGRI